LKRKKQDTSKPASGKFDVPIPPYLVTAGIFCDANSDGTFHPELSFFTMDLCRQVGFNRFPEKVPEKVSEFLVQSQVRFNRVSEKVPEKVPGGFGAGLGQVQRVQEEVPEKVAEKVPEKFVFLLFVPESV
jgi:hypothetical protein